MPFFISFRKPLLNIVKAFSTRSFINQYLPVISVACSPGKKSQTSKIILSSLDNSWETLKKRIRNTSQIDWRFKNIQDSFFVSELKEIGGKKEIAVGIFDGVGGWETSNIDVKCFSWGISEKTENIFKEQTKKEDTIVEALKKGFEEVLMDKNIVGGGATVCLGQFYYEKGNIKIINLGDSGYSIYRNGILLFKSNIQTHFFNAPFQLSKIPLDLLKQSKEGGKTYLKNEVDDADIYNHDLKHGDVIVFATDGVLDNLFFENMEMIITKTLVNAGIWLKSGQNVLPYEGNISKDQLLVATQVSKHLVVSAKKIAQNTKIDTPFAQEARKHHFFYKGGYN
ncbi:hypothetical protein PNEG_00089 [Pneumocystis murina B123]|uniref:Protein phosphatase n=1 Tax=Pneumocystis murina (strain B123) TaxID=1069680 RepID=M7NWW3_PNEMU|nr:hypothetical protein PNEG_00089 [Pneumocystis murina B123]EMR11651.1 hypothetical protein PNEG_00089 [Pneumocystis murina B123]